VRSGAHRQTATTVKERRQDSDRYRYRHKPDKRCRLASPCCPVTVMASGHSHPWGAASRAHRGRRQGRPTTAMNPTARWSPTPPHGSAGCLALPLMSCGCAAPRRCSPSSRPSTWDLAAAHQLRPATPAERATLWRAATPARPRRRAGATARNLTGLVDALKRDGLVERLPHPHDRRATLVRLTPAGDRLSAQLLAEQCAALAELLAELPRGRPAHPAGLGVAGHRAGTDISNGRRLVLVSPSTTASTDRNGQPCRVLRSPPPAGDRSSSLR
jgi:hypothetical protein